MRTRNRIITLTTDFGTKDAYVGSMKGVILTICPDVVVIDISHKIPKHNIMQGAYLLSQISPHFPEDSIHLIVVDPGVGTRRRRIIVRGSRCFYVGPDNGVLSLSIKEEGLIKAVEITNEKFMRPHPSRTFEGRDIFAPAAAHLAQGVDIDEFGPEIRDLISISITEPKKRDGELVGEIIHIDGFGNLTTNLPRDALDDIADGTMLAVSIGDRRQRIQFQSTYGEVSAKAPLLTVGSSGFFEIAVNQGSAAELFKAQLGDPVTLILSR